MNVAANIRGQMKTMVAHALKQARDAGQLSLERTVPPTEIQIERPNDRAHGDWATNAAMVLAREARTAPRQIAEAIVAHLNTDEGFVERAEVAGPGFINFTLRNEWLTAAVEAVLTHGDDYGRSDAGAGKRVLVEFVSANPTGPLNVVSARHATVGDVLGNVLTKAGYDVSREFYVNDAGNQVRMLGVAMDVRVRQLEGEQLEMPEGAYPGDYLIPVAREFFDTYGSADRPATTPPWVRSRDDVGAAAPEYEAWIARLARFAVSRFVAEQQDVLRRYRVEFDRWFHETEVREAKGPEAVVEQLRERGHTYEADGALWARTTEFGDDKDRVLIKSDGHFTYVVPDIAYHLNKLERGYDVLIDLLGRDHYGYDVRLAAMLEAVGGRREALEVMYLQLVHLVRGGEEVRMSKRRGEFVTMAEFLDEVSVDAARYFFLMRSADVELDFDIDLANLQTSDNPVYYVQYAHARIHSIFRQARDSGAIAAQFDGTQAPLHRLETPPERELIRKLADFPDEIELAAARREPHRLTRYAHEVAAAFHTFYGHCRVLGEDVALSRARLALCMATRIVLANTLTLLGIDAPSTM